MRYTIPESVLSPKSIVRDLQVLLDGGTDQWSLASLTYDGNEVMGVRWNGGPENTLGSPQSRGIPTWFVLPTEIADAIKKHLLDKQLDFATVPKQWSKIRIRGLPIRIWQGQPQEPMDYVWTITKVDSDQKTVDISNDSTGHAITLRGVHIASVNAKDQRDNYGNSNYLFTLGVQMVFEDGHIRLEPLSRANTK